MDFIISANTDIGISKSTNQDSLMVKTINTEFGKMVFAVLCDGMGGLSKGEVASATVIRSFDDWLMNVFPSLCDRIDEQLIRTEWEQIIYNQNILIGNYGQKNNIKLGTTVVVMLITESKYYIMNVGDSRAYEITSATLRQITDDQTLVAREVKLGNLTPEQAEKDPRRSVLLQCVGASPTVSPDMFFGEVNKNAVYMLCSDGFRHEISPYEIYNSLNPSVLTDLNTMKSNTISLIELNKQRYERDNISVVLVKTLNQLL